MRVFEFVIAGLLVLGGVRSLVRWLRKDFDGTSRYHITLYAAYITARVGMWFAIAGLFLISGASALRGRAFADEMRGMSWYFAVPLGLAGVQLLTGWLLGKTVDAEVGNHAGGEAD